MEQIVAKSFYIYMVTAITDGVKITVDTEFQSMYSNHAMGHYVFTYSISIENNSDHTIRLLRRHWNIFDSNGEYREVEGEGVIGQQPVIEPGEVHKYVSGCNFKTPLGKMYGSYLMERIIDDSQFDVTIPEFVMCAPYVLN